MTPTNGGTRIPRTTDGIGRPILRFAITITRSDAWPDRWHWQVDATPDDRGLYDGAKDGITTEIAWGFTIRRRTAERRAARAIDRYRLGSDRRQAAEASRKVVVVDG